MLTSGSDAHQHVADAWVVFDMLDLTEDLLPVPQPGVPPSPRSAVTQPGKVPGLINRRGQATGFPIWTRHRASGDEIGRWMNDERLGVCVQTRRARAIDIDVDDGSAAEAIERFVVGELGVSLPCRTRANSGKRMLLVIAEGELPKRVVPVQSGQIEFLGNGQQAVLAGTHPSGAPYTWRGGLPGDIPEITLAAYNELIEKIEQQFGIAPATGGALRQHGDPIEGLPQPEAEWIAENWEVRGEAPGGIYVRCPNESAHTGDSGPSEAMWLYAGSNGYERGHFRCLHAHCAQIGRAEFLEHIGYTAARPEDFPDLGEADSNARSAGAISASPYSWPEPRSIPRRRWLYGRQLLRGSLSLIVAPGGTGKTALTVGMALSLATGRPLLGRDVPDGAQRIWLWNLEDSRDELDRAIAAACQQHGVTPADADGRLFVDSGLDDAPLCTAIQTREGTTLRKPVYDALLAEINARGIDVLIVDPFVSSHTVPENDNGAIDAVAKAWARVAAAADCAIILVHHTTKGAGSEVTAERARGASALVNAARSVVTLSRMTEDEARKFGVGDAERRRLFRVYDDKNNRAPPAEASDWHRMESVALPNGEGDDCFGDDIGVVVPWTPPATLTESLTPEQVAELQDRIANSEWRENQRAEQWVGKAIAEVLSLNADDPFDRVRIKTIIGDALRAGWLAVERRRDGHRETKKWIVVGKAVDPACAADGDAGLPQCRSGAVDTITAEYGTAAKLPCRSAPPLGGTAATALRLGGEAYP